MKNAYFLAYNVCNPGGTTRYIENFIMELKKIGILSVVINHLEIKDEFVKPEDYIIMEEKNFNFKNINSKDSVLFICREDFFEKAKGIKHINPDLFIIGEIHSSIQMYKNSLRPIKEIDLYKVNTKFSKKYFIENYGYTNVINNYVSIYHIQDFIDKNILVDETVEDTMYEENLENNTVSLIENSSNIEYSDDDYEKFSSENDLKNIEQSLQHGDKNLYIHTRFEDGSKNIQYAIKLIAAYNMVNEDKISLYINGYGPCENMYKKLAEFYNVLEYVNINSEELPNNMVHISTSRGESFGYSIAEGLLSNHILVYRGIYPEIDEIYNNVEAVTFLNGNIYDDIEIIKSIWHKEPVDIVEQIQKIYENTNIDNFAKNYIEKIEKFKESNGKSNLCSTRY